MNCDLRIRNSPVRIMSGEVILRVPRASDEAEVRAAQAELAAEDFLFVFQKPGQSWEDYVASTERQSAGAELSPGRVPATMLLAVVDEKIVGRVHIRHKLTAELREVGGHIGYAVRPAFRRRGYATQMLRSALEVCRDLGLQQVLLTCDHNNLVVCLVNS